MKDLYEKIEQYLTDELSAEERTSFEQAMTEDRDLAAEVRLHQKMATVFEDPQVFQLRKELQQAGDSFQWPEEKKTSIKSNNIRYLYWVSAAAAILAGIIFLFLMPTEDTTDPLTNQVPPPSSDTVLKSPKNTEELAQETVIEQNQDITEIPDQYPIPETPISPDDRPIIDTPIDLLAANPAIEELITNFVPSKEYDFELEVQVTQTDAQSQFFLLGEVYTAALPSDGLFHLTVYDNQAKNYPDTPLIRTILPPTKAEEEEPMAFAAKEAYGLLFLEDLPAFPARYYYLIRVLGEEAPVAVGVVE
jgi:hypothetical protein